MPKTRLQKRLDAIDRHVSMLNALKKFARRHARLINEYRVKELQQGSKLAFQFGDYVLIVPVFKNGKVMLQLWRSGDDWRFNLSDEALQKMERLANQDVSQMRTKELETLLDKLFKEANPDEEEG